MVVGQLQPDFRLCWNRWVLVIFKPSFFMWSSLVSLISLFAVLRQDYYQQFCRQTERFQEVKALSSSPSGDRGPTPIWLRVLTSCQYLVLTLFICWNIAFLRKSKHLLFLCFNIGLWEKGCDYCFIPSAWSVSNCAFEFTASQYHFLNANLFFCLDCSKCVCVSAL